MPQSNVVSSPFQMGSFVEAPVAKRTLNFFHKPLEALLGTNRLKRYYDQVHMENDSAENFSGKVLDRLKISYSCDIRNIKHIPQSGPLVVVANHPFGVAEGLVMTILLKSVRPDVKIMANYMLSGFEEFKDVVISVDPMGHKTSTRNNVRALRESVNWVKDGHALAIFPSGTVSHWDAAEHRVVDPDWSPSIGRLIQKTGAPVVPIYFQGSNNLLFQLAGMISPVLRSMLIPRNLLNKRGRNVRFKIGNQISAKRISEFESGENLIDYLRFRTYLLGTKSKNKARGKIKANPLVAPIARHALVRDIAKLPCRQHLLSSDQYDIYYADAYQIPSILAEIGRLREISFRANGEGTGLATDLDEFDSFYTHLFVWDREEKEILGAYRMCPMQEVIARRGLNAVYSHQFFKYDREFFNAIPNALEMGRSFVQPRYQRQPASLFLLWRGIGHFVAQHPQYRILMGAVSTSNDYCDTARQLMVRYLKAQVYDNELASMIHPVHPFKVKSLPGANPDTVFPLVNSLDEVSRWIADIDPDCSSAPILLKHYLKLGGRIVGFNVDHDFCDVLDALIMVDYTKTDVKYLKKYMGKEGALKYLAYHATKPSNP